MGITAQGIVQELSGLASPEEPVFLQRGPSRYIVGADLAQASDWTAVCVLEHKSGVLDRNGALRRHCGIVDYPQVPVSYQDVRHLERMRGLSYVSIIERIKWLLAKPPLCGDDHRARPAELVVDATGVGRGVVDMLADHGVNFVAVNITSGTGATHDKGPYWNVSKLLLVSTLDAALHSGRLRIAAALTESGNLAQELKDFRRSVSAAGRASYEARANQNDDLVLSIALGCWWLRQPGPPVIQLGGY